MRTDDDAIVGRSPPLEREWLPEGALLVLSALAVTLLFTVSSLDIAVARWFYRSTGTDHWPLAAQAPWPLLYRASSWVTASLVITGLAMLAAGTLLRNRPWRRQAVFVLLSVVLGPGLLGNMVLKDHWNHPRPREIVEFGPRDEAPDTAPLASRRPESWWLRIPTVAAALGAAGVLVALFATPHGTLLDTVVPLPSLPQAPRVLEVQARKGTIEIALVDTPASHVTIRCELHGFGLPLSRLGAHVEFIPDPVPRLLFRIEQRGLFTDLDGFASLRVPAAGLEQVVVRLRQGDIRVTDATRQSTSSST